MNQREDEIQTPITLGSNTDMNNQEFEKYLENMDEKEREMEWEEEKEEDMNAEQTDDIILDEEDNFIVIEDEDGEYEEHVVFEDSDILNRMYDNNERNYEILTVNEMIKRQENIIKNICELLCVTSGFARALLIKFGWKEEKVTNLFLSKGKEALLKEAGLSEAVMESNLVSHNRDEMFCCPLCCDTVPMYKTDALMCNHRFCNSCWKTYIELKVSEGKSKGINCMEFKCEYIADEMMVLKFISDKIKQQYSKVIAESFVEDNRNAKWCPGKNCNRCVINNAPSISILEIKCDCGEKFCFSCSSEPHLPCSCDMLKLWQKKCSDDSETFNWLNSFTKNCPKCSKSIEKNGGCNHMSCPCGHHFCWICLGDFNHQTYRHSCGRYSEDSSKENSRKTIERYLHYYNRWKAHNDSRMLENRIRDAIREKVNNMINNSYKNIEAHWLQNGTEVLFNCRKALQYSYVFAYYIFDETCTKKFNGIRSLSSKDKKIFQTIFEDNQQELENSTEKLSNLLEKEMDELLKTEIKNDIISTSILADGRFLALFDIIEKELVQDSSLIPSQRSVLTGSVLKNRISFHTITNSATATGVPKVSQSSEKIQNFEMFEEEDTDLQRTIEMSLSKK